MKASNGVNFLNIFANIQDSFMTLMNNVHTASDNKINNVSNTISGGLESIFYKSVLKK